VNEIEQAVATARRDLEDAIAIVRRDLEEEINGLRLRLDQHDNKLSATKSDVRHLEVELGRKADEFHDHE